MHITKIELEDIKSHTESKFEFERGTTAIMGENGAGKTTLIEAVAWTLFDFLNYKKDDFVRRGAKKGVAKVTFESGLDERRYMVYRDTKTGYYVYDPKLKTRIADKKEEVTRFLWQHLGVEVGTDLESLFRRAIGVPQGTFTAIFLESPTERKKAFDRLLKVEEYRQSADKLRDTVKYIDSKIVTVREKIAHSKGKLSNFNELKSELKDTRKKVKTLGVSVEKIKKDISKRQKTVEEIEKISSKIVELKSQIDIHQNEKSTAEVVLTQKENEKSKAKEAASKVKLVEADYQNHLKALGMIKELERERGEREKLNSELAKIEAAIVNVKAEQKVTVADLDKALKAHKGVSELKPKVQKQEEFEKHKETLRNLISNAKSAENQILNLDKKVSKLREQYRENQTFKTEALEKSSEAKHLELRQKRNDELLNELAGFRAKLERDQEFQSEIKNGLCPILTEKCLNLKEGQTLESFVSNQFSTVKSNIGELVVEKKELDTLLLSSRKAEKFLATLETLTKREQEISKEGVELNEEKENLEKNVADLDKHQKELNDLDQKLSSLDNPKTRYEIAKKETEKEIPLREKRTSIESNLERLESDRRLTVEKLESYKDLDSNWKEFSAMREKTAASHREYLANETIAKSLPEKSKELKSAQKELDKIVKTLSRAQIIFNKEKKGFQQEKYEREKQDLAIIKTEFVETNLNHQHLEKRESELQSEVENLEEIRLSIEKELKEKERLEKVGDVTAFIRKTLKEAAPRVAKNYVYHVSIEANQMFREITGNAERTLKWADDYGILLEEDGFDRPFPNLSGGEQMAAALSVRLALLKQLSDVRIAFFDEPTMNMDAERRERLAEQISQITQKQTFDQLFVISHDDTFESYVDNVITITN